MSYSWVAADALTGRVITDLPGLSVEKVGATLCDYWSGRASLPVIGAPADWVQATSQWASYLVLLDDGQPDPIWGGWVVRRDRNQTSTVALAIASWEAYLLRRFTGDLNYAGVEQCALAASIVTSRVVPNGPAMLVEYTAGSTTRDRTYVDAADKTVLAALQELAGVDGGPEWTVQWRHLGNPERYVPVLTIADRIGVSPPAGLGPAATFELPGPVVEFSLVEDWAEGSAANHVIATSSADADVRPQSTPQIYADPTRPRLEYRFTPSTSITNTGTLDAHARRALDVLRDGAAALTITAARADAPRLGVDWRIGDDVGYRIQSPSVGLLESDARAIAWESTVEGVETVTPILASSEEI